MKEVLIFFTCCTRICVTGSGLQWFAVTILVLVRFSGFGTSPGSGGDASVTRGWARAPWGPGGPFGGFCRSKIRRMSLAMVCMNTWHFIKEYIYVLRIISLIKDFFPLGWLTRAVFCVAVFHLLCRFNAWCACQRSWHGLSGSWPLAYVAGLRARGPWRPLRVMAVFLARFVATVHEPVVTSTARQKKRV